MGFSNLIYEAALIIGIPVIALLFYSGKKNKNNILLGLSLLNVEYSLLMNVMNQNMSILDYPFLIRTGSISVFLFFPFFYLYARNTFYPGFFLRKKDWLWFIPVMIYILDMTPFYLSNSSYKIAVMKAVLSDSSRSFKISEGWISLNGFHFLLRYISGIIFFGLLVRLVIRNKSYNLYQENPRNTSIYWHLVVITLIYGTLIFPGIFGVILHLKWYGLPFNGYNLSFVILSTAFFLLFSPQVLYGFSTSISQKDLNPIEFDGSELDIDKQVKISQKIQSEETLQDLSQKIEALMIEKKAFLNADYSIHQLSMDISVPVYQLSPFINNQFNKTFNSWINEYRVNYFLTLCKNPQKRELTLEALAIESGFSNRTTFISAFKKQMGITPSVYIKTGQLA